MWAKVWSSMREFVEALARGYQVFGVSKDSQASHIKFKEKVDTKNHTAQIL